MVLLTKLIKAFEKIILLKNTYSWVGVQKFLKFKDPKFKEPLSSHLSVDFHIRRLFSGNWFLTKPKTILFIEREGFKRQSTCEMTKFRRTFREQGLFGSLVFALRTDNFKDPFLFVARPLNAGGYIKSYYGNRGRLFLAQHLVCRVKSTHQVACAKFILKLFITLYLKF